MSNRDDFSEQVKMILRDRVGGLCSNPYCRKPTTGPHTNPSRRTSIGKAAHITAAAKGGPRYNQTLTSEQRSSADNGIWLCANCADLIDKDEVLYSVNLLLMWKAQAEAEQANRLLNPNSYQENTIIYNSNSVVINATSHSIISVTLKLWRELGGNLDKYQSAIDFAYINWKYNFKDKYPRIHIEENGFFNADIQGLQDEIDLYGETLYKSMLNDIHKGYKLTQTALVESIAALKVEMSQKLDILLKEYIDYMSFHYDSDEGVGLVNYYWSSFFICLDKNYERMKEQKAQIDCYIREEYSMAQKTSDS